MKPHSVLPYAELPAMTDAERVAAATAARNMLATRRTCRMFSPLPVPRKIIEQAILAAGSAPSGANHQPWHFAVITSPDIKQRIRIAAEQEERAFYAGKAGQEWLKALEPLGTDEDKSFLDVAPYLIVAFGQRCGGIEPTDKKQNYYVTESVGIACGMMLSVLHQAGLATLTHTPSPMGFLRELCARPADEKPLMIIVTGLPAANATIPEYATRKKPLERIASWL